ncbi:MAG: glycosyltransferase family 2 protein [Pseudomonadota bacterium]
MTPGVTVLIPVLNEADIIEANTLSLLDYLQGLGLPFEIILISNGSTDRTASLGRGLAGKHDRVRFLELPERGVGRAFALGIGQAECDRVVSVDMDLSIDLGFIPRALELLDYCQIVVGSKKMGAQARALWRKLGSTIFILTVRALLGLSFEDYSIAAKAYRREVVLKYLDRIDQGTSYVLDIICHALRDGCQAVEIPVFCEDYRPSKFNLVYEALYRFRNLFRLWWKYRLRAGSGKSA